MKAPRHGPVAPALLAFGLANARYWPLLARHVRGQMRRWEAQAQTIADPELRALALSKLRTERFNAEAAAILATLAPRPHRRDAAVAIVALELMFDFLDGLTERPLADPLGDGARLYAPFTAALAATAQARESLQPDGSHPQRNEDRTRREDGYARQLARASRASLRRLPGWEAVAPVARRCALRGAEAQTRMHAVRRLGLRQAREWAEREAQESGLGWREHLAGAACSVLGLHALVAAAADPRTSTADAERIDAAYLPIGTVVTLLDGLVDRDRDLAAGELSYAGLYGDPLVAGQACASAARRALQATAELRDGPHHAMTLAGAVAYWGSQPEAGNDAARPAIAQLRAELGPLLTAPMLMMRAWRASRRGAARC